MDFYLHHSVYFEKWDWRALERGIGGSETSQIELSWRLARRGHRVVNFAPIPDDCTTNWRNTTWLPLEQADFTKPGVWIVYRAPNVLENFASPHPDQQVWLLSQDESYRNQWTEGAIANLDRLLLLSPEHMRAIAAETPALASKIFQASNGLRVDAILEAEAGFTGKRNNHKLIYASSPDRGLLELLKIFRRAHQVDAELELHIFYGTNNIEKLIELSPRFGKFKSLVNKLKAELDQPGVTWHGRIGQRELYQEWLTAGIWCYPTWFPETSCITSMESQALGAIPIINPYWALADNVKYGVAIQGDPRNDLLIQARYVEAILAVANSGDNIDLRKQMMRYARSRFNWEREVDRLEKYAYGFGDEIEYACQSAFQHKHAHGKILNIGANEDWANFKARGAINVDLLETDPVQERPNKVDLVADARKPLALGPIFDSVVLGDILEHLNDDDIQSVLRSAKNSLRNGGNIIITVPDDPRSFEEQARVGKVAREYTPGVAGFHSRRISESDLRTWVQSAGLSVKFLQPLEYPDYGGWGVVAC